MTASSSLPVDSLSRYIQKAYQAPMLSLAEEQSLARRYRDTGDREAARQLVFAHIRFVVRMARNYQGFGLPLADLVQEGTVGLMKAVKRFDPDMGVRLVSFAVHWIKSEMHEFILKNWRIVKVATTKSQRKLFFNLHKFQKSQQHFSAEDTQHIAHFLNVSEDEVRTMAQRLATSSETSVDTPMDDDHAAPAQHEALVDARFNPAQQVEAVDWATKRDGALYLALDQLDARSRAIVQQRWLNDDKTSLQKLAAHYGVSIARIGQIEKQAMTTLRQIMGRQLLSAE